MTSYFKELKAAIKSPSPFVAGALVTIFFALSGPFGTYTRFELGQRLFFWAAFVSVTLFWGILFRVFLMTRFPGMSFWRAAFFVSFASAFILALPFQKFLEFMAGAWSFIVNVIDSGLLQFVVNGAAGAVSLF